MGDRYELTLRCEYCKNLNKDIWYAPTCNSLTFKCKKCNKFNFITTELTTKKLEKVTYSDIYCAINNASNFMNEEQIKECAKQTWKKWRKTKDYKTHLKEIREKNG